MLFTLINKNPVVLSKPASLREKDESCIRIKSRLLCLKVVNDSSKRALDFVTEFHESTITKSSSQKQFPYQVIKNLPEKQSDLSVPLNTAKNYKVLKTVQRTTKSYKELQGTFNQLQGS